MIAVFTMLTRFRPHLQGPKEYAAWLKDERRFVGEKVQRLEIREVSKTAISLPATSSVDLSDPQVFRSIATHPVEISYLRRGEEVLGALRTLGFSAENYQLD